MTVPLDRHHAKSYFDNQAAGLYKIAPSQAPLSIELTVSPSPCNNKHPEEIGQLERRLRTVLPRVKLELLAGIRYSVWYGYGCKQTLLDEFRARFLCDEHVLSLDGIELLRGKRRRGWMHTFLQETVKVPTVVLVNHWQRLDGEAQQDVLACVHLKHLVVSVIREIEAFAPLSSVAYHDFTTMRAYGVEEVSGGLENGLDSDDGEQADQRDDDAPVGRGTRYVLQSLTPNAQSLFRLLIVMQQDESPVREADLFDRASKQLLVGQMAAFRTLLVEFIDHGLVVREGGGLRIPAKILDSLEQQQ